MVKIVIINKQQCYIERRGLMEKDTVVTLERKLKPINVWSLALGCIIGWGAFVMPGTTFLPQAGPMGTAIGIGIGAAIMILIALNYGYMIEKYPVAGGEYTFAKVTFGEKHAFLCGWFLGLSYLSIVPLNATALGLVSRKLLGGFFEFGYLYTFAGWDIYVGEILFASAALIIFGLFSIKGISVSGWLQTIMALSLVASVVILSIGAFISPNTSMVNLQPNFPEGTAPWAGIIAVVAVAPWAFVGFDSIPQAAEEFNFSPKKANGIMILSIIIAAAVYIAMTFITASVVPWQSFLEQGYDWHTGEAIEMIMGKFGLIFLGIALICAVLSGIVGFYMASSRLLFSMAREESLPPWFAKIDKNTKTPRNAILFIMAISLTAPWFGREVLNWIVDMSSMGAAIGFGYTCAASFVTMRRNPQDKKPVLKVLSILGVAFSICFVLMLIVPGMPSYLAFESRIALLIWILLGILFYTRRKKKNV